MPLYRLIEAHVLRPPNACMAMTPRAGRGRQRGQDRCSPSVGYMYATTDRSPGRIRQRRSTHYFAPAGAAGVLGRQSTRPGPGSCKPTLTGGCCASHIAKGAIRDRAGGRLLRAREAQVLRASRRRGCGAREKPRRAHRHDLSGLPSRLRQRLRSACSRIERSINGSSAAERLTVRRKFERLDRSSSMPVTGSIQLAKLSRNHDLAKAINYVLRRWDAFTRFLEDGRVCVPTTPRNRRCAVCPWRKASLLSGSNRGGQRAAVLYTLHPDGSPQRRRPARRGFAECSGSQLRRPSGCSGLRTCFPGTGHPERLPPRLPDGCSVHRAPPSATQHAGSRVDIETIEDLAEQMTPSSVPQRHRSAPMKWRESVDRLPPWGFATWKTFWTSADQSS